MPKRFTDTEKWKDEWFVELSKDNKLVWGFLCDNCTNAGRWKKAFKLLNFCCDVQYTEQILAENFSDRLIDTGGFYFIPGFLKYQYPKGLNSSKPAIIAVRNELIQYDLIPIIRERLGNDYLIIKDKDKDTDKDKDKDNVVDLDVDSKRVVIKAANNNIRISNNRQGLFVDGFRAYYKQKTGHPYNDAQKDYILVAKLIAKHGVEVLVEKTKILAEHCQHRNMWFTKDGWCDFTIGKLEQFFNKLLPSQGEPTTDWLKFFEDREKANAANDIH